MPTTDDLNVMLADLKYWFGFSLLELDGLTLNEINGWLEQASRQSKAGYHRG